MENDRFAIALIADAKYRKELAERLGINPSTEYGIRKLNEYLDEERKSDELRASVRLQNNNPGKFFSYTEIRQEAKRIREQRLAPYVEQAKIEQKLNRQQNVPDNSIECPIQEIKIDNQYKQHKDSYTYRQILVGLRNEFLEFEKKLNQLSKYVLISEDTMGVFPERRDDYYFNLYKNPFENKRPELVIERAIIRKRLLEKLGMRTSPTRAFMVKDNNGAYYPLRKNWFEDYQFNMVIRPGYEKEFQECAEEILDSDFAKHMMRLNSSIHAVVSEPITYKKTPTIMPNLASYGFTLCTRNSQFKYLGRNNIIEFTSVRMRDEKWLPLTQEHLNFASGIEFSKDAFSEYHQGIIEKSIDDDRPIVLSKEYQPETFTRLEIQDSPKQLILTKAQSKRIL